MHNEKRSDEWYTPPQHIEAAWEVLGDIDLDPASCAAANEIVKAARYYTREENGLALPWYGRVWLNPPFGRVNGSGASMMKVFTQRLIEEYQQGNVTQAILLSTVQTNASWFHPLWNYPLCFSRKRVHFYKPTGGKLLRDGESTHMLGTVFVYFGPNEQKFIDVFSKFGRVVKPVD